MAPTLAQALKPAAVDIGQLERDYKPLLSLVRELLGVVPNADPYLEIWPPGFQTYNVLVPNLLNLPAALLGAGASKDLVGLAMYTSSRAAECMYCSAHTCTYAMRRGASRSSLVGDRTPAEHALVAVAEGMSRVPADLTHAEVVEFEKHFSAGDAEWIVLAVAMMGYLNKFMDSMGIELEADAIADVQDLIGPTGWNAGKHQWDENQIIESAQDVPVDGIGTYFRMLRFGPAASRLGARWSKGVRGELGAALMMLEDEIGYSFPFFSTIGHKRVIKALAAALRLNLSADNTQVGLAAKCMTMLVYGRAVGDEVLSAEAIQLTSMLAPEIDPTVMLEIGQYATASIIDGRVPLELSPIHRAVVQLAKAASGSPSSITELTVLMTIEDMSPAQIVEVVNWLSLLQLLHRLYVYNDAKLGIT